jgi:hypothetical protein
MSNQLQITGGAKVRNLNGVITGTTGVLGSVPLGAANGVATLDSSGKVPVSQLPASVVTYLGTWNAATNTPTLVNGTGDPGDLYICNVAGTVNFGAGPISFVVGDWVLYGSGTWQKSSGQNGTVTSVAVTETGDALTITGSPITTAGTINIGFAGTSAQYVAGNGTLITFPSFINSIGLSMPSAFSVANSPLTSNGTISVTGAGSTSQYIDGTGALQTFPTIITQAQNLVTQVYNETGATLTKGTVVYINGGHGNLPTITKAIATSDATSAQTYGVVRTDITNNNNGYVTVIGNLDNLDTQAYAAGTQLYLSSTTAGAWTSTKQYAPAHLVYVGIVTRSHPTQGVVEIKIQNGFELDELHNVSAQTPTNNQGLFYNSSNSLWENKSIATALGYTPADDSLVVKLAGTQTITGQKTFANNNKIDSGSAGLFLAFKQYSSSATGLSGYTSIYAVETKFGISFGAGNDIQFATASPTLPRLYTFPNASGTVALTSDIPSLSGYVQGTGTTNYLPKFTGTSTIGNSSIIDDASTVSAYTNAFRVFQIGGSGAAFYLSGNSTQATMSAITSAGAYQDLAISGATLTFFSGTLGALGSSLAMTINPSGNVSIGNSNNTYKLDVSGTGRFTGALTGTSATFSSKVQVTGSTSPSSGSGLEIFYDGSYAGILGYNRTGSAYLPVAVDGSTVTLFTSSSPRLHVTSGGNVGIGTTSPSNPLTISSTISYGAEIYRSNTADSRINLTNTTTTNGADKGLMLGEIGVDSYFYNYANGAAIFGTNATERMRITSGGNVGIGTTSPSYLLTVYKNATSDATLGIGNTVDGNYVNYGKQGSTAYGATSAGDGFFYNYGNNLSLMADGPSGVIKFSAGGNTERMRITSGGNVCIGGTSYGGLGISFSNVGQIFNYSGTGVNTNIEFKNSNGTVGYIQSNGTTTAYVVTSDYRLKEDFKILNGLEKVLAIKTYDYKWKNSDDRMDGVIAHELAEVLPYSVYGEKDAVDENGKIKAQGVDYSKIVPILIKSIQELKAEIDELKNK